MKFARITSTTKSGEEYTSKKVGSGETWSGREMDMAIAVGREPLSWIVGRDRITNRGVWSYF